MLKPDTTLTHVLFSLVCILGTSVSAREWHVPTAEYRLVIREDWRRKNTVLVRLPEEFQHWKFAKAFTSTGVQVGCRPVLVNNKLRAVEVAISNGQMADPLIKHLFIYPTKEESALNAIIGQPVSCSYMGESFVARPANCNEMQHYLRTHPKAPLYRTLPKFPVKTYGIHLFYKIQQKQVSSQANFRSLKVRALLKTNLFTATPEEVTFAIGNNDSGPWYLFLNNKPVFSWDNAIAPDNKLARSEPVKTQPGLNRLDLYTFPDRTEMFPNLLISDSKTNDFVEITRDRLFSANECLSYQLDHKEHGTLFQFSLNQENGIFYRESGEDMFPYTLTVAPDPKAFSPTFSVNKTAVSKQGNAGFSISGKTTPLVVALSEKSPIQTVTIPIRPDYFAGAETIIKLRVTELPFFEPIEDSLVVSYSVSVDHGKSSVPLDAEVVTTYRDSKNAIVNVTRESVSPSPFKRSVTIDRSIENAASLSVALMRGEVVISNTIPLYLVTPSADLAIPAHGGALLAYNDGYGILHRQRGIIEMPRYTGSNANKRVLIDGFIAQTDHPLDPAPEFQAQPSSIVLGHLPLNQRTGDQPQLVSLLHLVSKALATDADTIIIAMPFDVINTLDFRDQRELVLFIAQSIRAARKQVAFVSNPDEGTVKRKKLRDFALMLKEIGRSFSIPVIDLYSASLRNSRVSDYWILRQSDGTSIRTTVPNATGQEWMLSEIYDVLEQTQ